MKRLLVVLALAAMVASLASAADTATVKGPIVDKIIFNAKSQIDVGIKDVAEGRSDLWRYATDGAAFKPLPDDIKSKLDVYSAVGATYNDMYINPIPNAAPYLVTANDGKTYFNPFAIREVRFALNYLVDRKKIVDEIMLGAGVPMYTPVTPGQPNSTRYDLVAKKYGFTATGNEKKALADIEAAMNKAAALAENKGKLVKKGQWWQYNGQDVSIKYVIRVDDPTMRLPEGRYIANQIEKAGIRVERIEVERAKAFAIWRGKDPRDYTWNVYTDGWVGGQTNAFWESGINQMYAPWVGQMPGNGNPKFWNYENADLDKIGADAYYGRVKDSAQYYDYLQRTVDIGLQDAVRVFLVAQVSYYATNKDRFAGTRVAWGIGDGMDKWSLLTADVKPETTGADKGKKVMRMTDFSSASTYFSFPWDPIGSYGGGDAYSSGVSKGLSDLELEANPVTGIMMPIRATWKGLRTDITTDKDGNIVGKIAVPADALIWNAMSQKWESGFTYNDLKGDGSEYGYVKATGPITAYSTATFTFKFGKWHDGRMMDINDYRYAQALPYDVAVKKGADDKVFEEEYAGARNPGLIANKGVVFNKDNTITVYQDSNYPMDEPQLASLLAPSLLVQGNNYNQIVCWEILEAVKALVSEGSASKEVYVYNSNGDFTEIDLLAKKCVADIKAKLQEFVAKERVPTALKGFVTPAQAVANYKLAIAFIDKYGHSYISNGPFILESYDAANKTGVMLANRDPSYPIERGYWTKALATKFARIDAINVGTYRKGSDTTVGLTVSDVSYPSNKAVAAAKAAVKVSVVAGDKTFSYTASLVKAGSFQVTLPAKDLDTLKAGSYTVVVEAALGAEAPTVDTSSLVIF